MWYQNHFDEMNLQDRMSSDSTAVATPQQPIDTLDDDGLPEFSLDEISKHKTAADGIWVTHGRNVYDITEFVEGHPGGKIYFYDYSFTVNPLDGLLSIGAK